MNPLKQIVLPIFLTGIWINLSEFFRNEILVKSYWVNHYQRLNLTFPSEPVNGFIWMSWGFLFALVIFILSRRYGLMETTLLSWLVGFVLMWLVVWNLKVLPAGIIWIAGPLSLLEAFVAALICRKMSASEPSGRRLGND